MDELKEALTRALADEHAAQEVLARLTRVRKQAEAAVAEAEKKASDKQ